MCGSHPGFFLLGRWCGVILERFQVTLGGTEADWVYAQMMSSDRLIFPDEYL
jgi:hypothetical protein